jgi:hypothetical protein
MKLILSNDKWCVVQMSLYEDLVAAWVPAKHEWLRKRPLGEELVNRLGNQRMLSYCACMSIPMAIFYSVLISFPISFCTEIDSFVFIPLQMIYCSCILGPQMKF